MGFVQSGGVATWLATFDNGAGTLTKIAELEATGTIADGAVSSVVIGNSASSFASVDLPIKAATVTSGNVSGAVGVFDLLDINGATAAISWTLPPSANVGERVAVRVSTDAQATVGRELRIFAADSSDKINGIAGYDAATAPFTRLLIKGETLVFRCVSATNPDWVVEINGRKPCIAEIGSAAGTSWPASTAVTPNFDTTNEDNFGGADLANDRINIRRGGTYIVEIAALSNNSPTQTTGTGAGQAGIKLNGTGDGFRYAYAISSNRIGFGRMAFKTFADGDNASGEFLHAANGTTFIVSATQNRCRVVEVLK